VIGFTAARGSKQEAKIGLQEIIIEMENTLKEKKRANDWSARILRAKACNARLKTLITFNIEFKRNVFTRASRSYARKMRALQSFSFIFLFAVFSSGQSIERIDSLINEAIEKKQTPGAVVLVGHKGKVVWRKAYGNRSIAPQKEAMTVDTIFDLASLTKIVATTTSVMILVERGRIRLQDSITNYIPELKGEGRERITIELLLTHRSGYAPDFDLGVKWTGYDAMLEQLYKEPLRNPPGARFVYSDIGMIVLGEVVRRVSGMPLDEFARKNIYVPLKMKDTGFNPSKNSLPRIAPTENVKGQLSYLGSSAEGIGVEGERILRGEVHDPTAFRMNGVAGHAGLFSTADDLAIYCQMILNGGISGGIRILSSSSVAQMTKPRAVAEDGSARGLGFDMNSSFSANRGDLFPLGSFGHTGFTGTSIWIDPSSETFVIFLSNRVHPDGKGEVGALRGKVATVIASAFNDTSVDRAREQEARFNAEVAKSLENLKWQMANSRLQTQEPATDAEVLLGIDVLERELSVPSAPTDGLAGKRIGLVTNHTGQNRKGKQTIDILFEAKNLKLVALFSPEHGIRGLLDDKVSDSVDEKTKLPIYSLYGETRRPKQEQLQNLDAIIFDIQDIGTRFYTYISTLGLVMEEASKAKIPVYVLDRPNPINGVDVEGAIADADKLSFVAHHTIPIRHGMTIGELAQLFNAQRKIGCDLRIVKMENWRRAMWFDQTNLLWKNPSPNMRSLTEATLYPGIGLLETTNLSVGRGTDTPFEIVGAPWIDGQKLAAFLNARRIAGVRFVPLRFTPNASVFKNEECSGINIIITDRTRFRSVTTGIEIALALRKLYPADWKIDNYIRLLVNADSLERVKRGDNIDEILNSWRQDLDEFRRAREQFLIYK
jgi:uncharacterized protein YbbC (DUF1343 family)/CubicO group peptidase (beta-lactamase class C family)